jgi:hypothetical protein
VGTGLLICSDLIWISKVTGTATALGLTVKSARDLAQAEEWVRSLESPFVIVDLNSVRDVRSVVDSLRALGQSGLRFMAFGSHVDTTALKAAAAAGCDPVLPNSRMHAELPQLLQTWADPAS